MNYERPVRSYGVIGALLRIPKVTVFDVCRAFQQRGHDIDRLGHKRDRFKVVTPRIKRSLLSVKLLQDWAPFTLKERSEIIKRIWNVTLSATHLRRFYVEHGIRFRQAKHVYKTSIIRQDYLDRERKKFAEVLGNLVLKGKPIVYIDETTFNTWMFKSKSRSSRVAPNLHGLNDERYAITVYGAVGWPLRKPVYFLAKSTNQIDFRKFLREVVLAFKVHVRKPILLFDGATAHTATDSMKLIKRHFQPMKNVAHSSNFNSIETLWSIAKRNFTRNCLFEK